MDIKKIKRYYEELKKEFADEEIYSKDFLEVAKSFVIHESKSEEKKAEQKEKPKFNNPNAKATKGTLDFLKDLRYKGTLDLTQHEASVLIDEYKLKKATEGY